MADPAPRFGFVEFAETWNGRLAMLGFVIGLATELLTGQSILQQIKHQVVHAVAFRGIAICILV